MIDVAFTMKHSTRDEKSQDGERVKKVHVNACKKSSIRKGRRKLLLTMIDSNLRATYNQVSSSYNAESL